MITPNYVDFHCHIDLFSNPVDTIKYLQSENIAALSVTTTPNAWLQNNKLANRKELIKPSLGLHPQLIASKHFNFDLFMKYLPSAKNIGEIGLDKSKEYLPYFDKQQYYFGKILESITSDLRRVLSIHSLYSAKEVLDSLEHNLDIKEHSIILHWFTGDAKQAQRALDMGCYFSVNKNMLENQRGKELIKILPVDKILLESDAPFVISKIDKQYYNYLLICLAGIQGIPKKQVNDIILDTSIKLLSS